MNDLYVYTREDVGEGRYKLLSGVVSDRNDKVDATVVIGSGKGKEGANIAAYWKDRFGYVLPCIDASRVE